MQSLFRRKAAKSAMRQKDQSAKAVALSAETLIVTHHEEIYFSETEINRLWERAVKKHRVLHGKTPYDYCPE